ncbi:MAG: GGDEF domain-containing protein [Nitrosomonas sp.]|nr:GGDEF domain-containing protein [Nitrosomonas sp.]
MGTLASSKTTYLKFLLKEFTDHTYLFILFAALASTFAFDVYLPLGIASGTPYVLIILGTLWIKGNQSTYITTVLGLALTVTGFYLSPSVAVPTDIVIANRALAILLIVCTMIMVLKIKKVQDHLSSLRNQAVIDPLTQCKNKRAFEIELNFEILRNKRYNRNLTISIFDIDAFKFLTFTHGQDKGEQILKQVSEEMQHMIRSTDLLYRIDTAKFAILFSETDLPKAKEVSETICRNITNNKKHEINVTLSAGLSSLNANDNKETIYKRAEDALLISQKNENNKVSTLPKTVNSSRPVVPAILSRSRSGVLS